MKNIKKLVSIFIAVTMVFSMTAMPVPIALADDEAYSPPTHVKDAPSGVKNNSWEPQHTHEHADRGVPATENREKSSVSIANRNTERPEKIGKEPYPDDATAIAATFESKLPSGGGGAAAEMLVWNAIDITADFKDPSFLAAVREILGKGSSEPVFDTDVSGITGLWVASSGITDLSGLEHFSSLEWLACYYNQISELPTLPARLEHLDCEGNLLTELPALPSGLALLDCSHNMISEMPSVLPSGLEVMYCEGNMLTELDLTGLSDLSSLWCFDNCMPSPDSVKGWREVGLEINNPLNRWSGTFLFYPQNYIGNDITKDFKDPQFREAIRYFLGKGESDPIYDTDTAWLTWLDVSWWGITSLAGIEHFTSLNTLLCNGNQLKELPPLPETLEWLYCYSCQLTALPELPAGLIYLYCPYNQIKSLPTLPENLEWLECNDNQLTELPTLPNSLKGLDCSFNQVKVLPAFPDSLEWLYCYCNQLTALPSLPSGLRLLYCYFNQLEKLPALPSGLLTLDCYGNQLTILPSLPNNLTWLDCGDNLLNQLPSLPDRLASVYCSYNNLTSLPAVPDSVEWLECGSNQLTALPTTLSKNLDWLNCSYNLLTSLPSALPSSLTGINCSNNQLTALPATLPVSLTGIDCSYNQIKALPTKLPPVLAGLDCSGNEIAALPAGLPQSLEWFYCSNNQLTSLPATLPANLKWFRCYNNNLTSLPVLPSSLLEIYCDGNRLTALPALPASLTTLSCSFNQLKALPNVLPPGLTCLHCAGIQMTALPAILPCGLVELDCSYNQLSALPSGETVEYCSGDQLILLQSALPKNLEWLDCSNNQLTSLPKTLPPNLHWLYCDNNLLEEIDLSGIWELYRLHCYANYIPSPDSVGRWRKLGLEINSPENPWNGTFLFYNQLPDRAAVGIRAQGTSYINKDVEYTVSVANAVNVLEVELTFEFDGSMLAGKGLAGLGGFETIGATSWVYLGEGIWRGSQTIGCQSGEDAEGLTSTDPFDIAEIVFAPRTEGEATVTLTHVRVIGKDGTEVVDIPAIIEPSAATTAIELVYSKYDLNRDGTVDALDLGIMLLYCGYTKNTQDWDTYVKVNDSKGVGVTASMCDVNGDGRVDMLDLLDLFIHYGAPGWLDPEEPDQDVIYGVINSRTNAVADGKSYSNLTGFFVGETITSISTTTGYGTFNYDLTEVSLFEFTRDANGKAESAKLFTGYVPYGYGATLATSSAVNMSNCYLRRDDDILLPFDYDAVVFKVDQNGTGNCKYTKSNSVSAIKNSSTVWLYATDDEYPDIATVIIWEGQ